MTEQPFDPEEYDAEEVEEHPALPLPDDNEVQDEDA